MMCDDNFMLSCRLNQLENTCIDIEAEEEVCREAIMKVSLCECTCVFNSLFCWQVQHDRVQSMKKIANGFKGLVDQQKDHTVVLLKHETVIVEREGVQKRFADLKHCLEEAQVAMWCALNETSSFDLIKGSI